MYFNILNMMLPTVAGLKSVTASKKNRVLDAQYTLLAKTRG